MLANIGLLPLSVPVHSCGTSCAEDCTQLLEPATLRPSVQGSRLCGPQYGVDTLLAGFSRTMAGVLPTGAWQMTLLCISSEPAPSYTITALAWPELVNSTVLFTISTRPWLRTLMSPPMRTALRQPGLLWKMTLPTRSASSRLRSADQPGCCVSQSGPLSSTSP